ncbi:MAG: hypothetical protein DRP08_00380 [Candidatus Aenigmatarchaeota archaeon]|nr:MAG: hypothetical protein DRP08_00380 [Candidatus Aenigmarchaeota archaeon]
MEKKLRIEIFVLIFLLFLSNVVIACSDSDGGKNIYVKGKAVGLYSSSRQKGLIFGEGSDCSMRYDKNLDYSIYYDCCDDSENNPTQLNEAYCENGVIIAKGYRCKFGCVDGRCRREDELPDNRKCVEYGDNGYDIYKKGYVLFDGKKFSDACVGVDNFTNITSLLIEYFCDNDGGMWRYSKMCGYGCENGVCLKEGKKICEPGEKKRACSERNTFTVYECTNGYSWNPIGSGGCAFGCENGACKEDPCNDKDGYYGNKICGNDGNVYAIYRNYFSDDSGCKYTTRLDLKEKCNYGCKDGICLGTSSTTIIPAKCYDSDGGRNYYVKGTVTGHQYGGYFNMTDKCEYRTSVCVNTSVGIVCTNTASGYFLTEYYCSDNGYALQEEKKCEYGCGDGKCLEAPQNISECIEEGGRGSIYNDQCCKGLTRIAKCFETVEKSEDNCICINDGEFYCTKCGDGVCKSPENKCNCPEDCEGKISVSIACPECEGCPCETEIPDYHTITATYEMTEECLNTLGIKFDTIVYLSKDETEVFRNCLEKTCNASQDCPTIRCGTCDCSVSCVNNICVYTSTSYRSSYCHCGDNSCDKYENSGNCPQDCKEGNISSTTIYFPPSSTELLSSTIGRVHTFLEKILYLLLS